MPKILSRIISVVLHPLFIPNIGLLIIFNSGTYLSFLPAPYKRIIYIMVFISTIVIPLCLVPVFLGLKLINSIEMETKKERIIPLLFTAISFYLCFHFLERLSFSVPVFISSFILASTIAVFFNMIITRVWKISSHLIGIGGLIGMVIALAFKLNANVFILLMVLFMSAGMLAAARLRQNAHNPAQVYSGFFLGLITMLFFMFTLN